MSWAYSGGPRKSPAEGPLRGIAVQNLTPLLRQQLGISPDVHGVVVTGVAPGSAAAQYLEQGDVILSIDHHEVNSVADFNKLAAEAKGKALLRIIHQGQARGDFRGGRQSVIPIFIKQSLRRERSITKRL